MVKIRSIFGGLALKATLAFSGTNEVDMASVDKAKEFALTSIGVVSSNDTRYVELKGKIYTGDTKHYKIQTCSNLVDAAWQDSTVNTDVFSKKEEFCVYEPIVFTEGFYRIVRKDK
jgi:hypothetical protein